MTTSTLWRRSLAYYWRTNLAVIAGAAIAVAVLAGAAMVGDSVRASLRELFLARLGSTDSVIASNNFFREKLAAEFSGACPLIALEGIVSQNDGRRANGVAVYGVDDRFWRFHGLDPREPQVTAAVAREIGVKPGDSIVVRVQKPSAIPAEWLHGRKEDTSRAIRLRISESAAPFDFSLHAGQGDVRAVYVPLRRLQRDLEQPGKVNTILISGQQGVEETLRRKFALADVGLKIRGLGVESESALIPDGLAAIVQQAAAGQAAPIFTYLANTIRVGAREIPYSLVTATPEVADGAILLNDWAMRDLDARPGQSAMLEYYVWKDDGRLVTESAQFTVHGSVNRYDRDLAPDYPGLTDAGTLHDWDPPFPVDLKRIRPKDEAYWKAHRASPKAFIALKRGQELWGSRFGKLTSIRLTGPAPDFEAKLRSAIDPLKAGITVAHVRAEGLQAAQGSTDFGEYFLYFSFFLVASALLLTGLFFKLGVEQRLREIGLLRALGFSDSRVRNLFFAEGLLLAAAGGLIGIAGAAGYAAAVLYGLRTWWVDAVGTRLITLHIAPASLIAGAAGGILTAGVCIALTLRSLRHMSPRSLLTGSSGASPAQGGKTRRIVILGAVCASGAIAALFSGSHAAGFFGAGSLLLAALLCFQWTWLAARHQRPIHTVAGLGLRSAAYRPGRSVLSISLIAFATFLISALDAFRRDAVPPMAGYPLLAESILPVYASLPAIDGVQFARFRLKPGDDASCLNLYQPRNPRVLGAPDSFIKEQQDPAWRLLETSGDVAIPAIVDANSLQYVLHKKIGDIVELDGGVRLQLAGTIHDSIFQRELIVSETHFRRAFPRQQGYRFFLIRSAPERLDAVTRQLEDSLSDYGFDVSSTAERLASFHRVENTYLSTFRALGALGLLLGTAGLAAVLLRNVLETRRELALLEAVGYRAAHLSRMVLAENTLLLTGGLATGAICAAIAIAPAIAARGGPAPLIGLLGLLAAVFVTGMAASLVAIGAVRRSPLLQSLRSD